MKANELQIGDWVNFLIDVEGGDTENDPQNEVYQPMQVNTIASWEVGGEVESREGVINDPEQLLPIPLTEEILEKNGFVKDETQYGEDFYEFWSEDLEYCMYLYLYDVCFFLFDNINMQIKYVHELQHAMRLCNIEKKIEL